MWIQDGQNSGTTHGLGITSSRRQSCRRTSGVQTGPGAMAFTLIPWGIRMGAKPFVKVTMAPCRKHAIV